MLKVKPELWKDIPSMVNYLKLEIKLQGDRANIAMEKSGNIPDLLRALPIHLEAAEFFVDNAATISYTWGKTEERQRYAATWLRDQSKWTPGLLGMLTVEHVRKFVYSLGLHFLVTIVPKQVALDYMELRAKAAEKAKAIKDPWGRGSARREQYEWVDYDHQLVVLALLRRQDLEQWERDKYAQLWEARGYGHPAMVSAAMLALGVSREAVLRKLQAEADGEACQAPKKRWLSEYRKVKKEGLCSAS